MRETTCTRCGNGLVDYRQHGRHRLCICCVYDVGEMIARRLSDERDRLVVQRDELVDALETEHARRLAAEVEAARLQRVLDALEQQVDVDGRTLEDALDDAHATLVEPVDRPAAALLLQGNIDDIAEHRGDSAADVVYAWLLEHCDVEGVVELPSLRPVADALGAELGRGAGWALKRLVSLGYVHDERLTKRARVITLTGWTLIREAVPAWREAREEDAA